MEGVADESTNALLTEVMKEEKVGATPAAMLQSLSQALTASFSGVVESYKETIETTTKMNEAIEEALLRMLTIRTHVAGLHEGAVVVRVQVSNMCPVALEGVQLRISLKNRFDNGDEEVPKYGVVVEANGGLTELDSLAGSCSSGPYIFPQSGDAVFTLRFKLSSLRQYNALLQLSFASPGTHSQLVSQHTFGIRIVHQMEHEFVSDISDLLGDFVPALISSCIQVDEEGTSSNYIFTGVSASSVRALFVSDSTSGLAPLSAIIFHGVDHSKGPCLALCIDEISGTPIDRTLSLRALWGRAAVEKSTTQDLIDPSLVMEEIETLSKTITHLM